LLEIQEQPYDSSKVKFHDKMDMFFRMKDVDKVEVEGKRKTDKGKKNKEEKPDKVNEYINAYELRKKEQSDRRFQLLFLKRLENDGANVSISKQDRELLRNFSKVEDEVAERDLKMAMEADGAP
jgi:hypothetical protein